MSIKKMFIIGLCFILISTLVTGCVAPRNTVTPGEPEQEPIRSITDMAGREVEVPAVIEKTFSLDPVGSIALYTLCPEKMIGWNYDFREGEKQFLLPEYLKLPNLGGWFGKGTGNIEEILKQNPDVLIYMGSLSETMISLAEKVQEQINIPVIIVDGQLEKLHESYIFLGDLLGEKEKAHELATYCKTTIDNIVEEVKKIPEEDRIRIFYSEGASGLETDAKGSPHTQVIDLVGGINVADSPVASGRTTVSVEQLMIWDPDMIIAWDAERGGYYNEISKDSNWKDLKAVQRGEVYQIPYGPFNWFDRPASVSRLLGVKWLANLLYPEIFDYDLNQEVKEFYSKFYHFDLTDADIAELLRNAQRKQ